MDEQQRLKIAFILFCIGFAVLGSYFGWSTVSQAQSTAMVLYIFASIGLGSWWVSRA